MLDRGAQGDAAAERVAHDVRCFQAEEAEETSDVVGHQLEAQRPVDIGRTSMGLQIDTDDLAAFRQERQVLPKHFDCGDATVEQDERFTPALDLVVQVQTIDRRIAGLGARSAHAHWACPFRDLLCGEPTNGAAVSTSPKLLRLMGSMQSTPSGPGRPGRRHIRAAPRRPCNLAVRAGVSMTLTRSLPGEDS